MASSRDLRIQIAGDATKLHSAVDAAERKLASLATISATASDKIVVSNRKVDDSFLGTAKAQESAATAILRSHGVLDASYKKQVLGVLETAKAQEAAAQQILASNLRLTESERKETLAVLETAKARRLAATETLASDKAIVASAAATGGALGTVHKHALAGTVAVAGLFGGYEAAKSAVDSTIQLGKATAFLSSATGTSVTQSSQLAAVMQSLGIESAGTAMNIKALSKQTELQIAGTSKSATAFDKLGISQQEALAHSHDMVGLLELVANRLQSVQGGTQKITILTQLFGRSYQNINPLIRDGGKALAENIALADKYGVTLNAKTLPKILEMAKAEREHKLAMLGLKVAFTDIAGKPMIEFEHRLASILNDIRSGNWADLTKQTRALGDGLARTIQAVTPKLADAFAQAGPKIVLGLIHGFTQASVGGELLIGALLVKKFGLLGAFTAAGGAAAKAFAVRFGLIAEPAIAAEGAVAGTSFMAAFGAAALLAAPAIAVALGLKIGSALDQALGITGGGLSAGRGEGKGSAPGSLSSYPNYPGGGKQLDAGTTKFGNFVTNGLSYAGLDQGVDFTGKGSLRAPADIRITKVNRHSGWPGGTLIAGQITSGPHKGRYVYFAEALTPGPGVAPGKTIAAGSEIASLNSSYPGSESGFAQDASGRAYGSPSDGKGGNAPSPQAVAFADFIAGTASRTPTGARLFGPSGNALSHPGAPAAGGAFRTVGASVFGGPGDPSTGHTGYRGDNLDKGPLSFAELGMGHNLGGLPHGAGLVITYKGRSVTAYKLDIGLGGGNVKGHRRDIDLYYRTAQALGFTGGLDLVQIRPAGGSVKGVTGAAAQGNSFAAYQQAVSDVDLQGQAGTLNARQVAAQDRALGAKALAGGFGPLDSHEILQVKADIAGHAASGSDVLYGLESKSDRASLRTQRALALGASQAVARLAGQIDPFNAKQARIENLQNLHPVDLSTVAGETRALGDLRERKGAREHVKTIYEQEVAAIKKEIAAWSKSRDTYRKLARKAKGAAKAQALQRAAGLQKMIDQGAADIQAAQGSIADTDVEIKDLDAQIAQTTTDATDQQQSADFSHYQQANSDIDLQVAAGLMTPAQGDAKKIANAQSALNGGFGALSQRDQWQVMADLKNATAANTAAIDANTQAQLDANKLMVEQLQAAAQIQGIESATLWKALADVVSGQIVGVDYSGRAMTAGIGTAARY